MDSETVLVTIICSLTLIVVAATLVLQQRTGEGD